MSDLRDQIIREHIDNNYPNGRIVSFDDADSGLRFHTVDELQEMDEDWFPLSCFLDKESGKVVYGGRSNVVHTYTEGETGAGKTTRFVMQAIRALSSMKVKPSFVLVDIHGEIIENLYTHFKENGYKIHILNCDDPDRSDTYNPFAEVAERCLKNGVLDSDTINEIRRIAEIMQPVEDTVDPIWDMGARAYTNGCILDKFEDLIAGNFPLDCMTIYNIIQHHHWLRSSFQTFDSQALFKIPHYKHKGEKALSVQKLISVTNNAERTRNSYFGVVENHYDSFGQPSLYKLSSSNDIDISDFIDEPTVIVIQSGSTKIGDDLISLLMNEIYTTAVKVGKANASKKLPRKIHCFLDEFANSNIADGPAFVKMLTTSRKFGMYWHMILQCDAQLDRKFDANIGRIIRANCTEIFMGSHDYETQVRFAKSCGSKTIESLASVVSQQTPSLDVVDLMTVERLNLTEEGVVYIRSGRQPLLKGYFEAFYRCKEFVPVENIDEIYPTNNFDYTSTWFTPKDIPPHLTHREFEFLCIISDTPETYKDVEEAYPGENLEEFLGGMVRKKALRLLPDRKVQRTLSKKSMELIEYRLKHRIPDDGYEKTVASIEDPQGREAKRMDEEISRWFNPRSAAKANDDDMVDGISLKVESFGLQDHIAENLMVIDIFVLKTSSAIPTILKRFYDCFYFKRHTRGSLFDVSHSEQALKFDILEEFVKNNDLPTKARWVSAFKKEITNIKKAKLFPERIMKVYGIVLSMIENDLTLGNIREIKKLFDEGDD